MFKGGQGKPAPTGRCGRALGYMLAAFVVSVVAIAVAEWMWVLCR